MHENAPNTMIAINAYNAKIKLTAHNNNKQKNCPPPPKKERKYHVKSA